MVNSITYILIQGPDFPQNLGSLNECVMFVSPDKSSLDWYVVKNM